VREEEDALRLAIAQLRGRRKLSQRQLSALLGWHHATIGKIERGDRSVTVIELIDIAKALDVEPAVLLSACAPGSVRTGEG
jgi:transcriptional regulator with XRE-family HTH domain